MWCEVSRGFDLLSLMMSDGEQRLCSCWSLHDFFGKMSVQVLCPIFNWFVSFWFVLFLVSKYELF